MRGVLAVAAVVSVGVVAVGQQPAAFQELRRWTWAAPVPTCAARSPSGRLVATASPGDSEHGLLNIHDVSTAAVVQSLRVDGGNIVQLRFVGEEGLEVRHRNDSAKQLSQWRHLKIADGTWLGERAHENGSSQVAAEPDALRNARVELGLRSFGADRAIARDSEHAVWVWTSDAWRPVTNRSCRALTFTPAGRHVVMLATACPIVVPVGGEPWLLPFSSSDVAALCPGVDGDDVTLVLRTEAVLWSVSRHCEVRRMPLGLRPERAATMQAAAVSPRSGMLAIVCGDGWMLLLDLATGERIEFEAFDQRQEPARWLSWSPDGASLWTAGVGRLSEAPAWVEQRSVRGEELLRMVIPEDLRHQKPAGFDVGMTARNPSLRGAIQAMSNGVCVTYAFCECRIVGGRLEMFEGSGARQATLGDGRCIVRHSGRLCLRAHSDGPNLATAAVDQNVGLVAVDGSGRNLAAIVGDEVVFWAVPRAR